MKHNRLLLFGTIIFISLIIMGTISAAEIKLISNTDYCEENCQAVYQICDNKLNLKSEIKLKDDFNLVYSDSKEQLKETIKSLKSKEIITEKISPECFLITIDGIKDKFANIDHVLYYDGIYYKEFAWWNSTFTKKKAINISTNAGITPVNFQIHLNVSYDSDMQADFDDIRFLDFSETNQLVYWVSNKSNSNYANVWVKSNDSITTAITTIWLYYGNPTALSESNGFDTFLVFDDFEDGDNTTRVSWSEGYKSGSANCGFGVQNFQGSYIQNVSAVSAFSECSLVGGTIPLRNYVMEMDILQDYDENAAGYGPKHGTAESTSQRTFISISRPENDILIGRVNVGFDGWITLTTDAIPSVNVFDQWIHFKNEFTQSATNISTYISHGKGNFNTAFQGMVSASNLNNNGSIEITAIRGTAYFDNILIREYFSGQIIYVPGPEQIKSVNIIVPQNITYYNETIDLIVSTTDFSPDILKYSLNGAANITFTSPTTFQAVLGNNNIVIWAYENETGYWYSDSEYFTAIFATGGGGGNVSITFNVDANSDATITRYSCSNNFTLKIDSNIRYCAGEETEIASCYWVNKTKYQNCEYGCFDGVLENGSYCSPPDYILWIAGLIALMISVFIINRFYRGR